MKSYDAYQNELEELKAQLKGAVFYLALPASFFADANAKTDDAAYFLMVTPKGKKQITQEKWEELAAKEDTEVYAMPVLSPKTQRLYLENTATYLSERKWKAILSAIKNNVLPARMNEEDQRLFNYLQQLPKNEQQEFLEAVNTRRMANAELRRQYKELMARREAMENILQRKSSNASAQLEVPENESAEERVARISRMIAADFGEDFTPFW